MWVAVAGATKQLDGELWKRPIIGIVCLVDAHVVYELTADNEG